MIKFFCYILVLIILGLSSCIPHRAYVASSFEPIIINQKNEKQLSVSMRPFKYLSVDFTHAISSKFMYKVTAGGYWKMGNFTGALLYYKNYKNKTFYTGPFFNYNNNAGDLSGHILIVGEYYYTDYNCQFYSPGVVAGLNLNKRESINHHFTLKVLYNLVGNYNYHYERLVGDMSGYSNRTYDNEFLNKKINPFFSCEASYSLLIKPSYKRAWKFQIGITLLQKTFAHNYTYETRGYSNGIVPKTTTHPVGFPVNISIGYIFSSKKKETKVDESKTINLE